MASKCEAEKSISKDWRTLVADVDFPCGPNVTANGTSVVTTCQGDMCTCQVTTQSRGINVGGLVAIGVFYVLILGVGLYAAWKNKKKVNPDAAAAEASGEKGDDQNATEAVMLANRSISLPVGIMTMTATWVGGGYINGAAEIVYAQGFAWCQAPFGFSASLLLGGLFFAKRMRAAGYVTMLDPFQHRFGRIVGALLFLPALTGEIFWSSAILSALGSTLSVIVDWDRNLCVIISASIAIGYTLFGGLFSVAYTDVVQLICIAVGLILAVPFAASHLSALSIADTFFDPSTSSPSSPSSLSVTATDPRYERGWKGEVKDADLGTYIDVYLLLIFGGIPWQVYFQRVLSAKTATYARNLSFIASVGCILMVIPPVLIGAVAFSTDWTKIDELRKDFVFTWNSTYNSSSNSSCDVLTNKGYTEVGVADERIQNINKLSDSSIVLPLALQYLTPPWVAFIGLGAVSAAVMSSTDSSILGVSSMFARNIYQQIFRPKASEREITWVIRIAIVAAGGIALALGLSVKSVYGLFFLCADFVYVILFPQLVAVVYLPFVNAYGSVAAYFIGFLLRIGGGEYLKIGGEVVMNMEPFIYYYGYDYKQRFPFRTLAMCVSFVTLMVVSVLAKLIFVKLKIDPRYDIGNALPESSANEEVKLQTVDGRVNYGMTRSEPNLSDDASTAEAGSERF